ncbi:protein ECERIFERUM 16 [Rhodamnia argentea]|uniref:Protein ECERIFERUM 16 n=1 Tax=Rhodamnia argentea TaxID=178133 RepID=A0A8B8QSY2_9MYRT|nr:protein ECERIFERUM 16 [Rhodamnia argentea]
MDTKSLARSKRAHSLHHSKKHHPSPKPKAPSGTSSHLASANNASGKQVPEKAPSRQKPKLPSNWDRYEEGETDSGLAESSEVRVSDVPAPKSKGADYRHLIAEAQSQSQSVSDDPCPDSFVSLGDVLPEFFGGGASNLLSVRGEAVLSWANEDSFVVDDKATSGHEVPFLSLNLNALAEQLAKLDLAKLLFIEPDLLPPEMHTGPYIASSEKPSDQMQTHKAEAAKSQLDALALDDFAREERKEEESKKSGTGRSKSDSLFNLPDDNISVDTSQVSSLGQATVPEYADQSIKISDIDPEKGNSTFEAGASEAELDALLNSFSDKLTEPSGFGFTKSTPAFQEMSMPQASGRGFISSAATSVPDSARINVLLDDLLEETSNFAQQNNQDNVPLTQQVNTVAHGAQSPPPIVTRSKELDDFDSWLDTI